METDVIVVGSGAGGLTTAIVAAKQGLDVLLVESTPLFGGTTAFSGGGLWIPNNHYMRESGSSDSRAEAEKYLRGVLGNHYDQAKVGAYLDNAPAMLEYLENNTELRVLHVPLPDYEAQNEGWRAGRLVVTAPYDARELGEDRTKLRPPRPELVLFKSMQFAMYDPAQFLKAHKSAPAFFYTMNLMVRYFFERIRYGRGMRIAAGNALVARLLKSAKSAGVKLWANAPAKRLVITNGAVTGAVVQRNGAEETIRARKGVILATGGFGANQEMRAKYIPHAGDSWSLQPEGNRGEGIKMGLEAGGILPEGNVANGVWQVASAHPRNDGSLAISIHAFLDRHCPGSLLVDAATSKRFISEGSNYQQITQAMHQRGVKRAWMIAEEPAVRKYGMGLAKPWPFPVGPWIGNGYLKTANTIPELATKIGLDPQVLAATVAEFNKHAENGADPAFHRGEDPYSRFVGDQEHKPNPSLGPVRTKPFYAVEMRPVDLSTLVGLNTNANAQVLGRDGTPVQGLYAVGLDSNDLWRGHYPGGGATIGQAMTFGYIAGRHIAGAP